jgi:hypothetical protein
MNNPDHISESLKKKFCVKILKFFDADPGFVMEKMRPGWKIRIGDPGWKKMSIRDKHPESAFCNTARNRKSLQSINKPIGNQVVSPSGRRTWSWSCSSCKYHGGA